MRWRWLRSVVAGSFLILTWASLAIAAPGDTLTVQTFTFDSLTTRRATFSFPDDERTWERILMAYTLKCDSATTGDEYPCGEWDVTTHTYAYQHTGRMDSTLLEHPRFIVDGESPPELRYSLEPRYQYYTYWAGPIGEPVEGDHYLQFEGTDYIEIPAGAVSGVDSTITISFWAMGSVDQPRNDHVIEMCDRGGRVVTIHLPWGTGTVYWDAGGRLSGANNRLAKDADPGLYKGRWNHWAFTKDARTGELGIYLNGELWHHAGNMRKAIGDVDRIILGANCHTSGGWYSGSLDQFRMWDVALDQETIQNWMHRPVTPQHPRFAHLLVDYDFDDFDGGEVRDRSPNGNHGTAFGEPQRRPFGLTGRTDMKPSPWAVLQTDSVPAPRMSVRLYEDEDSPRTVSRVLEVWPAYDSYFDGAGRWLENREIENPEILEQMVKTWYSEPFEVVETYEIGRFITPYGKRLDLGEEGFTWIVDVTDYAPLLRGEVELQAGNDFELLDLEFRFIEGAPPREVLAIRNIWPGGVSHRYETLVHEKELAPTEVVLREDASSFWVRSRISGHGHAGPRNCCEWDAKEHGIDVNGQPRFRWTVWRDCGFNPVYPQGGTWQFDRAGWCPGTFVDTYDHDITPYVVPGKTVILDYVIEPNDPDNGEGDGVFLMEHQLIEAGPPTVELDAALDAIIAPSERDEYRRFNPVSLRPIVRVRNLGADTLRSVSITYGLEGGEPSRFAWKGELRFLQSAVVTLPKPDWAGLSDGSRFAVELSHPNGERDQKWSNDRLTTRIPTPRVLPSEFTVYVETPGFGRAAENAYTITDASGREHASRRLFEDDQIYQDPIRLEPGAYVFEFTDSEEDGLIRHWWLRSSDPDRIGEDGRLKLVDLHGVDLIDFGYDFAEKVELQFFVGDPR